MYVTTLIDEPKVRITGYPSSRKVFVGTKLAITCEALEGKPFPTVQWYVDDQPVGSVDTRSTKVLDVPTNYTNTTITKYKCVGRNSAVGNRDPPKSEVTLEVTGMASCI